MHYLEARVVRDDGTGNDLFGVNHNGDFSGDVIFSLPQGRIRNEPGTANLAVSIPYEVLQAVVAEAIRRNKIAELEDMEDDEILGAVTV